jgi:hypothetical protein
LLFLSSLFSRLVLEVTQALPTRADDELAEPATRVCNSTGRLRREALVMMFMAVENHICAGGVERLPDRPHLLSRAMFSRAEEGVMPVGEHAPSRVRR